MVKKIKQASVLIVEDESELNEAYQIVLKHAGYTVKTSYNGQEALDILKTFNPDVILLDLRMPKVDGVAFLKAYNLKDEHPDVRVIIFSNYDMQQEIDEAFNLGAQRYMLKAWASPNELLQIVEKTLSEQ
ncbi:MAG: response regulator [Candidatus Saccharimonadales bacterium]